MTGIIWWLVQNLVAASVLVVVVMAICRMLPNRPALQHALWLVVLIKFVTPPIVWWPWPVMGISEIAATQEEQADSASSERPIVEPQSPRPQASSSPGLQSPSSTTGRILDQPAPQIDVPPQEIATEKSAIAEMKHSEGSQVSVRDEAIAVPPPAADNTSITATPSGPSLLRIAMWTLAGIWLGGSVIMLLFYLRRIKRHGAVVRAGKSAMPPLRNEIELLSRKFRIRPVNALVVREVAIPFVWCFGWLRLIWPENLADSPGLIRARGILAHELAHIRRRDHWVAWLELVAGLIWWWNPLFWFVRRQLRESAELACDALALHVLPEERRAFAELFLELSSSSQSDAPAPVLGVGAGNRRTFERRLTAMLSENVKENVSGWGLAAVCLLGLVFLPNWSRGQEDQASPSEKPPAAEPAHAAKPRSPMEGGSSTADTPKNPYSVTLSGVTVEVIGVLRNPRNRNQWWAPDGTLIPAPVDDIKFESPTPEGAAPAHEVALYVKTTGTDWEKNGPWATRHGFVPLPKTHKTWASLYRDFKGIGSAQVLVYPPEIERMTYKFSVAAGPWETIATFDGKAVNTELPDAKIQCTAPKREDDRVCFEVHHNLNVVNYHLRMRARLKDGKIRNAIFEPHDLRRTPPTGFVEAYGIEPDEVEEWILERSPWVRGEIPNIALLPKDGFLPPEPERGKPEDRLTGFELKRKKDIIEAEGTIPQFSAVDFETGKVQLFDCKDAAEKEGDEAIATLRQWAAKTGSDLVFSPDDPRPILIGLDIVLMRADSGEWFDGLYRPKLARNLLLQNSIPGFPTVTSVPEAVPAAFVFRTREGSFGVLQITEVDDSTLRLRYRLRPKENKETGAATGSEKQSDGTQTPGIKVASQTSSPQEEAAPPVESTSRNVVEKWLGHVKEDETKDMWDLTTRSAKSAPPGDLNDLWNIAKIQPTYQLGNDTTAMVYTNQYKDNSGRQRVLYFHLVKRDDQWLIDNAESGSPEDVYRRVEGFKAHPGIRYDVRPEDLIGQWQVGGFITVNYTIEKNHTWQSELPRTGETSSGTWELEGSTLVFKAKDSQTAGEVVRMEDNFFQLAYPNGNLTGFRQIDARKDSKTEDGRPPASNPKLPALQREGPQQEPVEGDVSASARG